MIGQDRPKALTILIPVLNEEAVLDALFERLNPVVDRLEKEFHLDVEILFTDNRSTDDTFERLKMYGRSNPRIKVLRMACNVGFQRSIITGYAHARGDACVQIDADLEDPPEMIIDFVEKWFEGYKVVYGVRRKRHEGIIMRAIRGLLYYIIDSLSETTVPRHAGDFRLIDRRIIDVICSVNDAQPYLRGIIASLGFRQIGIPYDRAPRFAGRTSFNLFSYGSIAIDGILQSSVKPLYLSAALSLTGISLSIGLAVVYIASWIAYDTAQSGFLTIVLLQLFTFSLLLLCIGILSIYTGRIYRQVLKRPISVVDEKIIDGVMAGESMPSAEAIYWPGTPPSQKARKLSRKSQPHF